MAKRRSKIGRWLTRANTTCDLEQLLQNQPTFPGSSVHMCTDDLKQELEKAGIKLPADDSAQRANTMSFLDLKAKLQCPISGSDAKQGGREYMEDRHICFDDICKELPQFQNPENVRISFYGVYDGHAGYRAAEICKNSLHQKIFSSTFFDHDVETSIQNGLASTDEFIIETGTNDGWVEGSCVSIVLIIDNVLFSANLGDSHIVLGKKFQKLEAISLSQTHKASEPEEKERITKAGGMVMRNRVFGDLSISRSLGDLNYKKPKQVENFVSNIAFTRQVKLTPMHRFVILASDGLWDKLTYQEAIEFVYQQLEENKDCSPNELSKLLISQAQTRGSGDNISVIVVLFTWK